MHTLSKGYDSNFKFYETYEMSPLNFLISFVRQFFLLLRILIFVTFSIISMESM